MKVILMSNVENLGESGDVVSVKPGYARNMLIPMGLALRASKRNIAVATEQKKVSLAKALINDPEILLLDEPTASLDPDVGDYIRTYLEDFASKKGTTILLASHNMNEVERLCGEVMMMKNGQIIDRGTCESLINKHGRKTLEETFLKIVRE